MAVAAVVTLCVATVLQVTSEEVFLNLLAVPSLSSAAP